MPALYIPRRPIAVDRVNPRCVITAAYDVGPLTGAPPRYETIAKYEQGTRLLTASDG